MIESLIGQRYRIKALIGEGGMASVYSAMDEKLERRVAVKILHPHLAKNPDIRDRFLLEAKTVSTLDHPNIIRVYDFSGLDAPQLWMVTEILYGEDLAEFVKSYSHSRLQFIVATLVTREICRALNEAHKLKIVHRDIKPENIMMLTSGQLKLMDFGIAKVSRANATQTGIFMGSPSYMSPEQIRGTDVDSRADIYSLSVLYYEIVTGNLPFSGKSTAEVINRIMVGRYAPPNLVITDLPYALNQIIIRGMKGQKEERYQSVAEMGGALDAFLNNCGLRESRVELEEFCQNRGKFEKRLAQILSNRPSNSGDSAATLAKSGKGQGKPNNIKAMNALATGGKNTPPPTSTTLVDTSSLPTLPPSREVQSTIMMPPKGPQAPQNRPAASPVGQVQGQSQGQQVARPMTNNGTFPPNNRRQSSTQGPGRTSTQPPRTPNSRRRPSRAAYRVFSDDDRRSSKSNMTAMILIAAAMAVGLTFMFGGDKLSNRFKRDSTRVTESGSRQPKRTRVDDDARTSPSKVDDIQSTPLESQTIVVRTDGKSKPKIPNTPVPTPTRSASLTKTPDKPADRPDPAAAPVTTKPDPATPVALGNDKAVEDKVPVSKTPDKPSATEPGILKLAALPAAEVYIDGKMQGTTNEKKFAAQGLKLEPGSYVLRFKRPGYKLDEQTIQIKAGESRQVNVTLAKLEATVELSIKTNKIPATIIIEENKAGGKKREMTMTKHSLLINLRPGSFKVTVSYEGETISRPMEISSEDKSLNFNAEFK